MSKCHQNSLYYSKTSCICPQFVSIMSLGKKKKKKKICVFQVSRPYLGFCPNPKDFIVNSEENIVKCAEKGGEGAGGGGGDVVKKAISIPYLFFFRAETCNTHIFFGLIRTCEL